MDGLFLKVQGAVAHPHTTLTTHDKVRAAVIFLQLAEELGDPRFSDYVNQTLSELELNLVKYTSSKL
jgi:hypothetical protein